MTFEVFTLIGGSAGLIALASYLLQRSLEAKLERQLESHKAALDQANQIQRMELEHANNSKLEQIKISLQSENEKSGFAYGKIYDKRLEVLEALYQHMVRLRGSIHSLIQNSALGSVGEDSMKAFYDRAHDFSNCYLLNKLYIPAETVVKIEALLQTSKSNIFKFSFAQRRQDVHSKTPALAEKAFNDEQIAMEVLDQEIPKIITEIEQQFKTALRIS